MYILCNCYRKIKPGTIVTEATSQMDIFPTVADILKAPLPQDRVMDGRNILQLLGGAKQPSPHDFLFHYCGGHLHAVRYMPREGGFICYRFAIVKPILVLIASMGGRSHLFHKVVV